MRFASRCQTHHENTHAVLRSEDIEVTFAGGTKTFSDAVGRSSTSPCGEELLVITNPVTLSAANTHATARRAAGFLTPPQIQAFIRSHLNHPPCIRPSYVTTIGDDALVPTSPPAPADPVRQPVLDEERRRRAAGRRGRADPRQ